MPNQLDLADFITRANSFVDSCRQLQQASQLAAGALDLQKIKQAASNLAAAAKEFDKPTLPYGGVKDAANAIVNATGNPNAALTAIRKLFVDGDTVIVKADTAGIIGGGGGDTVPTPSAAATNQTGAAKSENIALAEFMHNVSASLIESQKALNKSSLDYVSTLESHFPPAYYGIPSIKAEMKIGFQEMKGKGINLLLFTKQEQKTQYAESTVTFEVVGSPPPPGPVAFGDYVAPVPRFLVVGQKRDELIRKINDAKNLTGMQIYANTLDQVIVLRYEQTPDADHIRYLVIWPAQRAGSTLENWHTIALICVDEVKQDGTLEYPKGPETPAATRETIFEYYFGDVFTLDPSSLGSPATLAGLTKLAKADPDKIAKIVINLGDVVMNVNLILNQWLGAVKYQKPAPPPGK
jgi:hypothetical protein